MDRAKHQELVEASILDARRFGNRPIVWEMDVRGAMNMIGALQLAMRHREFQKSEAAAFVRHYVVNFRDQVAPNYPALARLIDLGFEPRFDQTQNSRSNAPRSE